MNSHVKITFDVPVAEMVREDLKYAKRGELIKHYGYKTMDYHEQQPNNRFRPPQV